VEKAASCIDVKRLVEAAKKTTAAKGGGKENLWILELLGNSDLASKLSYNPEHPVAKPLDVAWGKGLCVACKGGKFLCGKTRCPLLVRANYYLKTMPLISGLDVDGASPPSVFIGRIGYPYVYAGPMVPPVHEDTSLMDIPELWFGRSMDEIVGFRSMLVRGMHPVHVRRFEEAGRIMDQTRELALSVNSVDVELALKKPPRRNNVLVTKIQRAFSVGAFGVGQNRRLVPTRWSITAVDDILSKGLREKVKTYPEINEYRVYESRYLDNIFEVLMLPQAWSYEAMEAWYPGTIWNPSGQNILIYSDWEGYEGRTTYAEIGGCYYAARLAVCELLEKERRQATVIVLREAHPGYIMPVGVWQVRENVRNAMRQTPWKFNTLDEALAHIASQFQIPLQRWIQNSKLMQDALYQKRLTEYFKFT